MVSVLGGTQLRTAGRGATLVSVAQAGAGARIVLDDWRLQSSARVSAPDGSAIASTGFAADGWYRAGVPTTVLAALVDNGVYRDPYFGANLRAIPGADYPVGKNFANLPMPGDSPFRVSWWYRAQFALPANMRGQHVALHFDGINYRANIWLNGRRIAGADSVAGMFRLYEFDISQLARADSQNVLAVEVFPPDSNSLAMTWVDWNPAPPDKDMGLWRPVYLTSSGDVAIRHPAVTSQVDNGTPRHAALTVSAELHNLSGRPVQGMLHGRIERITFSTAVSLAPNETRVVRLTPATFPQLRIGNPRLWWPAELGTPDLYDLELTFQADNRVSDHQTLRFGIRQITSELAPGGGRLFRVNGRRLAVRGGGWAPDMMLRPQPERQLRELQYVLDMHLNTVRMEGKLEDERFFDLADSLGVLVMAGWCCCDHWEKWSQWSREDTLIAAHSERDQALRLRSRPSVLVWLNGSDNPPPAAVEKMYVDTLAAVGWPNPVLSSATGKRASTGPSGVKMTGPYDWVAPAYWLQDDKHGGAFGFNTETSPGPAIPPIETLRRMFPQDHLWPVDSMWGLHAGGGQFTRITAFSDALAARYGAPTGVEDFALKSQVMTYEGERAMFEAFARNRYRATGVIQWMLNDAWPSVIWHLYDWFLRPGGGYFGTKKALEPQHLMYSYDDRSIVAINQSRERVSRGRVSARAFGTDLAPVYSADTTVDLAPDQVARLFVVPPLPDAPRTYFLDLRLTSPDGRLLTDNLYWLSTVADTLDWDKSTWYVTPSKAFANLTGLQGLPAATVSASPLRVERAGDETVAHTTITNTGATFAFFVRVRITSGTGGEEILPVRWTDNYISLLPGESRDLSARYWTADAGGGAPTLAVSGWNVR